MITEKAEIKDLFKALMKVSNVNFNVFVCLFTDTRTVLIQNFIYIANLD